jgi:DNA-binding transcriptional regulator YhcF (GntR family)
MILQEKQIVTYLDRREELIEKVSSGEIKIDTGKTIMDNDVLEILDRRLEWKVINSMLDTQHEDGWSEIKYNELAYKEGCSEMTIRRAIKSLESKGLIVQKEKNSTLFKYTRDFIKREYLSPEQVEKALTFMDNLKEQHPNNKLDGFLKGAMVSEKGKKTGI